MIGPNSIHLPEPARRILNPQDGGKPLQMGSQHEWLSQAIARHGPALWDRLVRSLPKNQADALRQQLEAFIYELEVAALEDAEFAHG